MKHQKLFAFIIAVLTATTLACSNTATPPTAPTPPSGGGASDGSTLKANAPGVVSPSGGVEIEDLTPLLTINNASAQYLPNAVLSYIFEVINSANQVVYRSAPIEQGSGGRTSHEIGVTLNTEEVHTWRAWAVYQGLRGPLSSAGSFKTFSRFGVSCAHHGNPLAIIQCRHAQHGGMDHDEAVEFMREVAYDFNRARIGGHDEWGILVKTVGNNCHGYSCDIICEGNGNDQNQYDILIDEAIPNWAEVSEVTERQCEIIR